MKLSNKFLLCALILAGLELGSMTGCVGYVGPGDGGVYYGGDPWIHSDVIVTGRGWYGGHGGYVHPGGWHHR
jgi:hypothetical protein